jgi:hypothetical protein
VPHIAQDVQNEWVLKVLGVDVKRAAARGGKLTPIWTDAKERVDQGFDQLQRALRAVDDPDAQQLADYGLNGVTSRVSVKLMAALMEADSGRGTGNLVVAIDRFRNFLDGSPIVDLIEDNALGVKIQLREELGSALDTIAAKIAA